MEREANFSYIFGKLILMLNVYKMNQGGIYLTNSLGVEWGLGLLGTLMYSVAASPFFKT